MTSPDQRSLGEFGTDRPESEAEAVAGTAPDTVDRVVDPARDALPEPTGAVKIGITQVDYTIAGRGDDEQPIIHVFGRTEEGTAEHVRVTGFQPYFYAPVDSVEESELLSYDRITGWDETDEKGQPFESIRGERLLKIYGQTPRDVGEIRDEFEHYEADILFPNRFLIDKDIQSGIVIPERRDDDGTLVVNHEEVRPVDLVVEPRVCMLDIEVDDRRGFPEDGEEPIVCLTAHDSRSETYVSWLYEAPDQTGDTPSELAEYEPLTDGTDIELRSFAEEAAMLDDLIDYIDKKDFDVLSGWNFTDFDAPYLLDRLEVLDETTEYDLSVERLSRVNEVWRSSWGGPSVKGRVVFDLLYAYQRTKFTELDSYRLDDVGERELGVGKERYPGDIGDLWEADPEQLLEYNLRDVELCVELNRSQDIIPFWNEVRSFVGCKLEDATTPGDAVDMYVLHKLHDDFALPSKGAQEAEDYEGGAVFDPITGVRENVSVLDLKSLYPMCMVTINASPETKVNPDTYEEEMYRAPNGTRFRKEPDGAIREMVDELLTEREEKKALRNEYDPEDPEYGQYDRQQAAVKVIMNCFTPDTEVLTPAGVRNIRELSVGDDVYSIDPETMDVQIKPVSKTHEYPAYRGELIDIQTDQIDFRVTPHHRMLVRENSANGVTESEWDFVEAGALDEDTNYELPHDWDGLEGDPINHVDLTRLLEGQYEVWVRPTVRDQTFTAELGWTPRHEKNQDRGTGGYVFTSEEFETHRDYIDEVAEQTDIHNEPGQTWIPRTYEGDAFIELLAWYITDGSVDTTLPEQFDSGSSTLVQIAQEATLPDGGNTARDAIGELLDELELEYDVTDQSYQITATLLGDVLREQCGDGSDTKRIPDLVFEASDSQKRRFLETLINGDGNRQPNAWRYTTESTQLRDDVLRLCTHIGQTASYEKDSGGWRITCAESAENSFQMHQSGDQSSADSGVYSVTVADNHTLLAGRNGNFQFVGQSLYGVLGWDRFRLYDKEMGAAVTATGRDVIEFTEDVANDLGYEVVYGDSVTGSRPIVVRDPDGTVRIKPIKDLFDRATREQLAIADGGPGRKESGQLDGWQALSVTSDGTPEWRPINRVLRHETDKPVVRLQHPRGESTTTRDHSYMIEQNGTLIEAPPAAVDEPVRVDGLPGVDEIEMIDLYERLTEYAEETTDTQVYADKRGLWTENTTTDTRVKRSISVDSADGTSLLRLLAAYIATGEHSDEGVSITATDQDRLTKLKADYERLVNDGTARLVETDERQRLQLEDSLATVLFGGLCETTTKDKRLPALVFELPETSQQLFYHSVVGDENTFETASRELAGGLSMLLTQQDREHTLAYGDGEYTIQLGEKTAGETASERVAIEHDGYVYDLDVATNDTFVDAVGGVVLHNTDSVMLELGGEIETDAAIEQSFEIEEAINESYDQFAQDRLNAETHRFQIEFEKLYRRFFQAGKKKRYAGNVVWKEGKDVDDIDITGFEYQRSDIAPLTKEVQHEVIERIVYGEDLDAITSYLHAVIEEVLAGEVDPEEIAIPGGIGKRLDNYDTDTAQVRGARYANRLLGTNFGRGSKPKRIYLKKVHPEFFQQIEAEQGLDPQSDGVYREFKRDPDVICFEYADQLPEEFQIDWEKMLEKTLKGPIERILEALGISWDEVRSGQEQTGLGQFM